MTARRYICHVTLLLCVILVAGCERGPAVAPVEGVVTRDGEPIFGVMVEFQPDKGAPSYGYTDKDGRYELFYQTDRKGALLGKHTVSITTPNEVTDPETVMTINVPETIPVQYNDESEMYYEVVRGKNKYDVKIEGYRKRGRGRR